MGVKRKIQKSTGYDFVPIAQAFNEFIFEKRAKNLSEKTIHNYNQSYESFMRLHGLSGEEDINEINASYFYKYAVTMKQNGIKPSSINHYLRDCRTFFYWAMRQDYIVKNFKIEQVAVQEETPKFFSDEDIKILLDKPRKGDSFVEWRTWAIVSWVLGTGNRASTVCKIRIDDLDFNRKEFVLAHTKSKKAQSLPLSNSLIRIIKEYMRMWRNKAPVNGFLFPSVSEEQLTTGALRQSFTKYCKKRGVEQTNIHGLRHSFARGWVKNNGNVFTLQKVLGHSTLDITQHYVKLFSDELKVDFEDYALLDTVKRNSKRTQAVKRSI